MKEVENLFFVKLNKIGALMKKDNFISIGILLNKDIEINQIESIHKIMFEKYNYFEIILLTQLSHIKPNSFLV